MKNSVTTLILIKLSSWRKKGAIVDRIISGKIALEKKEPELCHETAFAAARGHCSRRSIPCIDRETRVQRGSRKLRTKFNGGAVSPLRGRLRVAARVSCIRCLRHALSIFHVGNVETSRAPFNDSRAILSKMHTAAPFSETRSPESK